MNSQYPNAMLQILPVVYNLRLMSISKDNLKLFRNSICGNSKSKNGNFKSYYIILPRRFPNGQIEIPHNSKLIGIHQKNY